LSLILGAIFVIISQHDKSDSEMIATYSRHLELEGVVSIKNIHTKTSLHVFEGLRILSLDAQEESYPMND